MPLLTFTNKGIHCPQAGVYIDPWKKVSRALITHGHSDHARSGHLAYLCTHSTVPVLKIRLGQNINVTGVDYGESLVINGVTFSFHPAGHTIGSAQIRAEYKGEIWVISGDYKVQDDGVSGAFEPVKCHHFITECTFGLPIYKWSPQRDVFDQINKWWSCNANQKIPSLIFAYSLGKAQRVIQNVDQSIGKIYTHSAVERMNEAFRNISVDIRPTIELKGKIPKNDLESALIVAPSANQTGESLKSFEKVSLAGASGWMMCRKGRRWGNYAKGFVLSDHADWNGLNAAIKETGAEHIYPTHGYTTVFSKWLNEQGYRSRIVETEFESETIGGGMGRCHPEGWL